LILKCFYQRDAPKCKLELHSFRFYGEPKLSKPKELKGIKSLTSIDFIRKKCRCSIFVKDNDIWIHHRDLFSQCMIDDIEDIGTPLIHRLNKYNIKHKKTSTFIYDDNWGSIVLRNEGWLLVKGLINDLKNSHRINVKNKILCDMEDIFKLDRYELCTGDYENFFDNLINYVYNNVKGDIY
jgi:hypothetical protein